MTLDRDKISQEFDAATNMTPDAQRNDTRKKSVLASEGRVIHI